MTAAADSQPRRPELDGLRGIAILLVIYHHYINNALVPRPGSALHYVMIPGRLAWTGVDLFFVLSGFLVGGILIRNRESASYYRTFYIRRACRILPIYLALVVGTYVYDPGLFTTPHGAPLWQYLTFTQNFWMAAMGTFGTLAVTWSLAIEEQFYLTAPSLMRWVTPERLGRALVACIVLAPLLRIALFFFLSPKLAHYTGYVMMPTRMDTLGLGMLAAWLHHRGVTFPMRRLYAAFIVLGAGMLFLAWNKPLSYIAVSYDLYALFYVTMLLIATQGGFRLLRWKPLAYVGLISYGLYLFHVPIHRLFRSTIYLGGWHAYVFTIVAAMVSIAAAAVSWHLLEKPFVKLGHRFGYEQAGAALR